MQNFVSAFFKFINDLIPQVLCSLYAFTSFAEENAEQANLTSNNVSCLHDMVASCTSMTRNVVGVSEELTGYIKKFDKENLINI